MIISVTANKGTFKSVAFQPGLNLILAERAEGSTDQDYPKRVWQDHAPPDRPPLHRGQPQRSPS